MYYITRIIGLWVLLLAIALTLVTMRLDFFTVNGFFGLEHKPIYIGGIISLAALVQFFRANHWIMDKQSAFKHTKTVYTVSFTVLLIACGLTYFRTF
jgi:hypothetical protein